MRPVQTALTETMPYFTMPLTTRVLPDPDLDTRWRIEIEDPEIPYSILEVEILDLQGDPVGCVLERRNIPVWLMNRFMNIIMERLEEAPHPPGGEPIS